MTDRAERPPDARVAHHLLATKRLDARALERARQHPMYQDEGLVAALDALGLVPEVDLLDWIAREADAERIDLAAASLDWALAEAASFELCWRHQAVPVAMEGKAVRVAMVDPLDLTAVDDFRFRLGARVRPVVASVRAIRRALARVFPNETARAMAGEDTVLLRARSGELRPPADPSPEVEAALRSRFEAWWAAGAKDSGELPVEYEAAVRLVSELLETARVDGSSHLRLDLDARSLRVNFRRAGTWQEPVSLPAGLSLWVLWHVKTLCRLPVGPVRRPVVVPLVLSREDGEIHGFRFFVVPEGSGHRVLGARVSGALLPGLVSWEWAAEGPTQAVLRPWWTHFSEGRALLHDTNAAEAETALLAAAEAAEAAGTVARPLLGETLSLLGVTVEALGRLKDASALAERAISVLEAAREPGAMPLVKTLVFLGELALRQGQFMEGVALLRNALSRVETSYGEEDLEAAWLLERISHGLAAQGLAEEAAACQAEATACRSRLLGSQGSE